MSKKIIASVLAFMLVMGMSLNVSFASSTTSSSGQPVKRTFGTVMQAQSGKTVTKQYVNGEVLVQYKSGFSSKNIASMLNKYSGKQLKTLANGQYALIRFNTEAAAEAFLNYANGNSNIAFASHNYVYKFPDIKKAKGHAKYSTTASSGVNDQYIGEQWYHDTIDLYDAWQITKGDSSIKVGVIDSGLDTSHPEFAGQVAAVKDFTTLPGVDGRTVDAVGHGTHVCGIIAAKANNSIGVAGVAPNVKLLMADIGIDDEDAEEQFTEDSVIAGIYWCVEKGARIINMSLTTTADAEDAPLKTAIKYATDKGVIVVCASGNDNTSEKMFPADDPNAVSVISVDSNMQRSSFSNYGKDKEISAPGGISVISGNGILSTVPMNFDANNNESKLKGYDYYEGTSMASPVVSGVFALLLSKYPGLTAAQAKQIVYDTATDDKQYPGVDIYTRYGTINAKAALDKAATLVTNISNITVTPGTPVLNTDTEAAITFDTDKAGYATVNILKDGAVVKTLVSQQSVTAGTHACSWSFTDKDNKTVQKIGDYTVAVDFSTTTDSSGYKSKTTTKAFTLDAAKMNVTDGSFTPDKIIQTKGSVAISAKLDQKGELVADIYKGSQTTPVREITSGQKALSASPITISWDLKDSNGKYIVNKADTDYTIKIHGKDQYGRTTPVAALGTLVLQADTTAPTLIIEAGDSNFVNTGKSTYKRIFTASGAWEPVYYNVVIKNSTGTVVNTSVLDGLASAKAQYSWNGKMNNGLYVPTGTYSVQVQAQDLSGLLSEKKVFSLNVTDATKLAISGAITDSKLKTKADKLKVSYKLSENAKINIKVYSESGNLVQTLIKASDGVITKGSHAISWNLKKTSGSYIADGKYTVKVTGDNGNGKGSNILAFNVSVNADNSRPKVQLSSGTIRYKCTASSTAAIKFKVNEAAASAALAIYDSHGKKIRTYSMTSLMKANTEYKFTWDGKDSKGVYVKTGSYYAKLTVKDLVGNQSLQKRKSIRLTDKTRPVISAPDAVPYNYAMGGTISIGKIKLSEPGYVTAKVYNHWGDYIATIASSKYYKNGTFYLKFNGKDASNKRIPFEYYPLTVKIYAVDVDGNWSYDKKEGMPEITMITSGLDLPL